MPIADDWKINYVTKQIYHTQWKDEITSSDSSLAEQRSIITQPASAFQTSGIASHFHLYSAQDITRYYVWYNITDSGTETEPVIAGATGVQVDVLAADTADQVASKTTSAINNHATAKYDFTAVGATSPITLNNDNSGSCTDAVNDTTDSTTFTISVTQNGVGKTIFTANALYSYLQDSFDELGQMDDKVPMSAQTPTDYTMINAWFIDEVSIKYLTGGALKTDGWASYQVVQQNLPTAYTNVVSSDLGKVVTETDTGDTGTLLFADNTRKRWWIRPDDPTPVTGDLFDDSGSAYTIATGTGAGTSTLAATTGENLWANVYTLGTIQTLPYPQVYIFQDGASISEWSILTNWDRGQIDVLIRVKEAGTEIAGASITVFARQGTDSYDHFIIDLTAGGRNAVPLSTATDLNYDSGDYYILYDTESGGPFTANEVIKHNAATSLWSARIVSITDFGLTGLLKLTNFKQTGSGLVSGQALIGLSSKATAVTNGTLGDTYVTYDAEGGTPPAVGLTVVGGTSLAKRIIRGIKDDGTTGNLVLQVDPTITGANRNPYYKSFIDNEEIRQNGTPANYYYSSAASTTIVSGWDDITVAFVNGTATFTTGSGSFIYGEKVTFTGGSGIVLLNSNNGGATGTLTLGNMTITAINGLVITGAISNAVATASQNLQSSHTMTKAFTQQTAYPYDVIINAGSIYNAGRTMSDVYEYLKFITQENSTFQMYTVDVTTITPLDGEEYIRANETTTPTEYVPVKSAPFGTFAGGTFFGAQSVWVEGLATGQSYTFIDYSGTGRTPYASITITVSSVVAEDRVSVFITTGGLVERNMYQSNANNAIGDTTIEHDGVPLATAIDTPTSGIIRVKDVSENTEHRYRYASWTGSVFTLETTGLGSGTVDSNEVTGTYFTDAGHDFSAVKVGDLVRNVNDASWAHVTSVNDSTDTITHTPLQGGGSNDWVAGETYSFNNLPVAYVDGVDTIYIPYIDEVVPTAETSISKTVLYANEAKSVLVRVRKKGILPFETPSSVTSGGMSVAANRTTDSIVT